MAGYQDYMGLASTLLQQMQQPADLPEYQAPTPAQAPAAADALRQQAALGMLAQMGGGPVNQLGQALFTGAQSEMTRQDRQQQLAEAGAHRDWQRQMQTAQAGQGRQGQLLNAATAMARQTKPTAPKTAWSGT